MAEEKKTRNYRSKDERKAELDKKIAYHKECIKTLEAKKASIDKGRQGGGRQKGIKRTMAESKLSDEQIARALGTTVEELREKLAQAASQKDAPSEG